MLKGLLGKKLGMTRVFDGEGSAIPVTMIECGPCPVLQVKTMDKDGYNAVQIGFGSRKEKHASKANIGHCKKTGANPARIMKECRSKDPVELKAGQVLTAELFAEIPVVDVIGYSKGRGFTGTIKRYHFKRGRETHGNKNHRSPGSVGNHTYPARVFPGKRLPGHSGDERVTIKNLKVIKIDVNKNLILVKGAIPGPANGYLFVKEAGKKD
jgi:large subunit ribosomal protein L3